MPMRRVEMVFDINTKNKIRFWVRMTLLVQFLVVVAVGLVAGVLGVSVYQLAAILTASTTALTTGLGLDYFTHAKDDNSAGSKDSNDIIDQKIYPRSSYRHEPYSK